MKLKDNKALSILAGLVNENKDELSARICKELLEAGIVRQDTDNGCLMLDIFGGSIPSWPEVITILFGKWSNEIQANFLECILMGDGDCEMCGGDMELNDGEYDTVGDGYTTPKEKEYRWREDKCVLCSHKQITGRVPDPDKKHDENC